MPKVKISEYSTVNSNNTDINSINIDEGCAPSGINNAIREVMVHLKNWQTNASGDGATFASLVVQGTGSFTGAVTMSAGATLSGTNTLSGSTVMAASAGTSASPSIYFSGDTNTGIFSPAADTIAFAEGGAEAMRIDSSGNVGIGTTSPTTQKLHISAASVSGASNNPAGLRITDTAFSKNTQIVNRGGTLTFNVETGCDYAWGINNSSVAVIDSSGNVGIGTTSPQKKLVISDGGNIGYEISPNDAGGGNLRTFAYNRSTAAYTNHVQQSLAFIWETGSSPTERMRIDSSGRVGIGTSSPTANYQLTLNGNDAGLLLTGSSSGSNCYIISTPGSGANFYFGTSSAKPIIFVTNGTTTERARITSDGVFCVNITAPRSAGTVGAFKSNGGNVVDIQTANTSSTTEVVVFWDGDNADCGSIDVNPTANTTAYTTASDYRLKENIAPMTGALNLVSQLNPCTWNWKHSPETKGQGFIAHELQEVCPDAVSGEKDATEMRQVEVSPALPATYDEDGNELTPTVEAVYEEREVPKYQGVDTSFLVATLTAAIQELKAITDAQATRIETLEAEVAAMKAKA